MNINRKYFYFRFKEDFFESPEIVAMEDLPVYGDQFIIILLKLYSFATSKGGFIEFENTHPKDDVSRLLAKKFRREQQVVALALSYFVKHGLIEIFEREDNSGSLIEVNYVLNNVGKSSIEADRVRMIDQKKKRSGILEYKDVKHLPDTQKNKATGLGMNKNVFLTEEQFKEIRESNKSSYETYINFYSIDKKSLGVDLDNDYEELQKYIQLNFKK